VNGSAVQRRSRETGGASPSAESGHMALSEFSQRRSEMGPKCEGYDAHQFVRCAVCWGWFDRNNPVAVAQHRGLVPHPVVTCEPRGLMRTNNDSVVRGGHFLQPNWQFESAASNVRSGPNSSANADIVGGQRRAKCEFVSLQPNATVLSYFSIGLNSRFASGRQERAGRDEPRLVRGARQEIGGY
jgi:hypothetical protein